ncbi:unnamed protein product [Ascophyllum nodosum]
MRLPHNGVITLHSFIDGGWGIIFTYPRNNDPVTCTELGMLTKMSEEFEQRNCKVLAIGVDSKTGHPSFIKDTQELQDCEITFPIVADTTGEIFPLVGLVREDTIDPARGLVPQVDASLTVFSLLSYFYSVGHNFYEMIRAIDALRQATFNRVVVPSNWKDGEDVLVSSSVPSADAGAMLPKGFAELRSWFRLTPQPDFD